MYGLEGKLHWPPSSAAAGGAVAKVTVSVAAMTAIAAPRAAGRRTPLVLLFLRGAVELPAVSCVLLCGIALPRSQEPCGWRALPVDRRGPVGRKAAHSAGTRASLTLS
ncbi:hypothetical protein GCM10009863_61260 [Streptomyces axinellae]|uniref:Uncharacterized protein n=1 Tax=Streptomyces axinellae TaxID=552788 RepID=A0ABP6D5M7_9ACTN